MLIRKLRQLFFSGRRSRGVTIFAFLLIASSVMHIHKLIVDAQWYFNVYSYYPAWLIVLRYSFSWLQRILGLLSAVGLLALNDVARKLAIFIGTFTILTIYWKHPYAAYEAHAQQLDISIGPLFYQWGVPMEFGTSAYVVAAVVINCFLDVLFSGGLIYFLTRPAVRKQFKKDQ